jgi:hypothetical protein
MSDSVISPESLRAHPKCLLTELDDGTGVVLNLDTKFYFTLNATAVSLWKELVRGARTRHELASSLIGEFEVQEAEAASDVALLIEELLAEGLVERVP